MQRLTTTLYFFIGLSLAISQLCAQDTTDPYTLATWTDSSGRCGQPGKRECGYVINWGKLVGEGCLNPKQNILREGLCNLPSPSDGQVQIFPFALPFGMTTFYFVSDVHYYRDGFDIGSQVNFPGVLNRFMAGIHPWPTDTGIPSGLTLGRPVAVVWGGDLTTGGSTDMLGVFRWFWEDGWLPDSLNTAIMPSLGNHDADGANSSGDSKRMWNYIGDFVTGVNMDKSSVGLYFADDGGGSHNYSWDWNSVHYVQLNTWAGDQGTNTGQSSNGLLWLAFDLAFHAQNGKPVILFQHYDLSAVGYSDQNMLVPLHGAAWKDHTDSNGNPNPQHWWSNTDLQNFINVIHNYNIVAMFTGHKHTQSVNALSGFTYQNAPPPAFQDSNGHPFSFDEFRDGTVGSGSKAKFYAAETDGRYLDVASLYWNNTAGDLPLPTLDGTDDSTLFPNSATTCRLRIDSKYRVVTSAFTGTANSITNTSGVPIPGPLAIRFAQGSYPSTTPSFVDSCDSTLYRVYVLVPGGDAGMAAGQTLTFPNGGTGSYDVVQLVPWSLDVSSVLQLSTPSLVVSAAAPPNMTEQLFAPGASGYTTSLAYTSTNASNWLSIPTEMLLNNGRAGFTLHFDPSGISPGTGVVTATVTVTSNNGGSATLNVKWTLEPQLLFSPETVSFASGNVQTVQVTETNGRKVPFTWKSANHPYTVTSNAALTPATVTLTLPEDLTSARGGEDDLIFLLDASSYGLGQLDSTLPVVEQLGEVDIATSPAGGSFTVDGTLSRNSQRFKWVVGQTHQLGAADTADQPNGLERILSWSDGGPLTHAVGASLDTTQSITGYQQRFWKLQTSVDPAGSPGSITVSPGSSDGYYQAGSTVLIQAVPNGSSFTSFSGDLAGAANPQSLTITKASAVVARFDPLQGGATSIDTQPTGKPMAIDGVVYISPQTFYWKAGESHAVTIPSQGTFAGTQLSFQAWTDGVTGVPRTITGVASGHTQAFTAKLKTQYFIGAVPLPSNAGTLTGGGWLDSGSTATILATAIQGYQFGSFTSPVSASDPLTFTVTGPATVHASFNATQQPRLYADAGARTSPVADERLVPINLHNTGPGVAGDATITGIANIRVLAGSGSVDTSSTTTVLPQIVGTIASGQAATAVIDFRWPSTATRVQFDVQFSANNGAYTGTTTLNLFR